MLCPPTPRSKLVKNLQKVANDARERGKPFINIKVVEKAGVKIKSQSPGLKEKEECKNNRETCFVHKNGGKGNCRAESIVYKGTCQTCAERQSKTSVYFGESSRSAYNRGLQHQYALENPDRNQNNAFCKHITESHQGIQHLDIKFRVDVIKLSKPHCTDKYMRECAYLEKQ